MVVMACTSDHMGFLMGIESVRRSWIAVLLACMVYISGVNAEGILQVSSEDLDAYQQLELNGLPSGLIPHIVTGYELNDDGSFVLHMANKCEVDIPSAYPVVYNTKISGKLSYRKLSNLSGVQVKISWLWFSITSIEAKGDDALTFSIGIFSQDYPIHPNFDENPICE